MENNLKTTKLGIILDGACYYIDGALLALFQATKSTAALLPIKAKFIVIIDEYATDANDYLKNYIDDKSSYMGVSFKLKKIIEEIENTDWEIKFVLMKDLKETIEGYHHVVATNCLGNMMGGIKATVSPTCRYITIRNTLEIVEESV